jgi:lipopolysaccharide/colanic/teichoic acid biosynthesis glycosyltransferase
VPALIQRAMAGVGLVVLLPVMAVIAIAVRRSSPGPAIHRATRVRPGGTFTLLKFRTMREGAPLAGPGVTASGDRRVTGLGRRLRRSKLDELPQLWNVVKGDMLLVGPRPEDPRYVNLADPLHERVFGGLPGITGPTALAYRDEEETLSKTAFDVARADGREVVTPADIDRAYREVVLPAKLAMDAAYLASRSIAEDVRILGRTFGQVLGRTARS